MKTILTFCMMVTMSSAIAATYEVPTSEVLQEYATFNLRGFKNDFDKGNVRIKYYLPYLLVGKSKQIKLEGQLEEGAKDLILFGDNAMATCEIDSEIKCKVVYRNLEINKEAATKAINAISKTPQERIGRLEIMRAFSTDPVGIITY